MKTSSKILIALGGLFLGAVAGERIFLSNLQDEIIHDDAKIKSFLGRLSYPIQMKPSFGFCRIGRSRWGYTYQLCVYSATSASCPLDSYRVQYLGPQSHISLISKEYYEMELQFRVPILTIDKDGVICRDARKVK